MILKIFSPKNGKNLRVLLKLLLVFPFVRRKLAKIAENCYHNIDPYFGKILLGFINIIITRKKVSS
jgi:hypothetical protein